MDVFIALSKGELGKDIEKYLLENGLDVQVSGKPKLVQYANGNIFRIVNSRDVPKFVGYWMTSALADLIYARTKGSVEIVTSNLDKLAFGKGDFVYIWGVQSNTPIQKPEGGCPLL